MQVVKVADELKTRIDNGRLSVFHEYGMRWFSVGDVIELTEEAALPGASGRRRGLARRWVSEWEPVDGD